MIAAAGLLKIFDSGESAPWRGRPPATAHGTAGLLWPPTPAPVRLNQRPGAIQTHADSPVRLNQRGRPSGQ